MDCSPKCERSGILPCVKYPADEDDNEKECKEEIECEECFQPHDVNKLLDPKVKKERLQNNVFKVIQKVTIIDSYIRTVIQCFIFVYIFFISRNKWQKVLQNQKVLVICRTLYYNDINISNFYL